MEDGEINIGNVMSIREKVDPKSILPSVKLIDLPESIPSKGTFVVKKYHLVNDDQIIGNMSISTDKINKVSWINQVNVENEYQGRGFGLSAHIMAIEKSLIEGNSFETHDWSHTNGSKHIWEALARKGIAKLIEPFEPDGNGKYIGCYEIISESIK